MRLNILQIQLHPEPTDSKIHITFFVRLWNHDAIPETIWNNEHETKIKHVDEKATLKYLNKWYNFVTNQCKKVLNYTYFSTNKAGLQSRTSIVFYFVETTWKKQTHKYTVDELIIEINIIIGKHVMKWDLRKSIFWKIRVVKDWTITYRNSIKKWFTACHTRNLKTF